MQLTFTNRLFVFQPHDINTITVSSCAGMMSSHISACAAHVSTAERVMEGASGVLLFQVHVERILRVSSSVLVRADVQSSGSNSLAPHCKEIQLLHTSQINRERGKRETSVRFFVAYAPGGLGHKGWPGGAAVH